MKITINESPEFENLEIIINCKSTDENLLKLITSIRAYDKKVTGTKDGQVYILDADDVYYFESVDKKTFIYIFYGF